MVVLHQFPGAYGLATLSPFCTKVGSYLRLSGIEHRTAPGNPIEAPRGKLPYARIDGALVPDSQRIIEMLETRSDAPLDAGLSPEARARGHLARRCVEEHLYFALLCVRWGDDEVWRSSYRAAIASSMPPVVRLFVPWLVRRQVRATCKAQGVGRLELDALGRSVTTDLEALEATLGDGPFLLGAAPTTFDCAVHAQLEHLRRTPAAHHPVRRALDGHPALLAYLDRMNERLG